MTRKTVTLIIIGIIYGYVERWGKSENNFDHYGEIAMKFAQVIKLKRKC